MTNKIDRQRHWTLPWLVGVVLAVLCLTTIGIRARGRSQMPQQVQQPILGGSESKREGPWPTCVGMAAKECVRLIETYAEDVRGRVHVVPEDSMVTMDFDTRRVRVWVDESEVVTKIPKRG